MMMKRSVLKTNVSNFDIFVEVCDRRLVFGSEGGNRHLAKLNSQGELLVSLTEPAAAAKKGVTFPRWLPIRKNDE